jgi:hypothetical protein
MNPSKILKMNAEGYAVPVPAPLVAFASYFSIYIYHDIPVMLLRFALKIHE